MPTTHAAPDVPPTAEAATPASRIAERGIPFTVVGVAGGDELAARLQAAGLWEGAVVELIQRAPFGDPLLFRVHGYRLALRVVEAARVLVRRTEPNQ